MIRRGLILLVLGSALGVLFATFLDPAPVAAEEAPAELRADPAQPTRSAKDISRPIIEATARVRPAVVKISNFQRTWRGDLVLAGSGSGFVISKEGHVLTNLHVVRNNRALFVQLANGRTFDKIKVLGADARSDVAVLRILGLDDVDLPVATLGDSDALSVGELVVAIGAPYNLDSSVSLGVVSATGRTGVIGARATSEEFIQTDAALNSGNSGGPLVNLDGQVVGINTAIQGATGANVGVGFSIPINLARTVAVSLIERGIAKRGWLGVMFDPNQRLVSSRELTRLGIPARGALRITGTQPGSPAARSGLRAGDLVTEVDGRPLTDLRLLHARLAQAGPGGDVEITYYRAKKRAKTKIRLAEEQIYDYGIEVRTLEPRRRTELGLPPDTQGVEVTRIAEGSVAARADKRNRLLPGDVIVAANWPGGRFQIQDKADFERVLQHFQGRRPEVIQFVIRAREGVYVARLRPDGNY